MYTYIHICIYIQDTYQLSHTQSSQIWQIYLCKNIGMFAKKDKHKINLKKVHSSTPFKFVPSTSFKLNLEVFECGDSLESKIAFFLMDLPAFLAITRNRDL